MDRREEIIACARELFEEQGLAKTSVRNITDRIGVTRTLFYHYFPDKDALVEAVVDEYIAESFEAMQEWVDLQNGDSSEIDVERALDAVVRLLRAVVFDNGSFCLTLVSYDNASLYMAFLSRVAMSLANAVVEASKQRNFPVRSAGIEHARESIYVLVIGLAAYVRTTPEADDETIKDIIAQSMRIERPGKKATA